MEEGQRPGKEGLGGGDWGPKPPAEIMTNLPHRRPYRRTGRRKSHAETLQGAETGHAAAPPARPAATRQRRASPRRSVARKPSGSPGLPELALNATVEAAKIPLGVTAAMARRAAELVGRGSRSG